MIWGVARVRGVGGCGVRGKRYKEISKIGSMLEEVKKEVHKREIRIFSNPRSPNIRLPTLSVAQNAACIESSSGRRSKLKNLRPALFLISLALSEELLFNFSMVCLGYGLYIPLFYARLCGAHRRCVFCATCGADLKNLRPDTCCLTPISDCSGGMMRLHSG